MIKQLPSELINHILSFNEPEINKNARTLGRQNFVFVVATPHTRHKFASFDQAAKYFVSESVKFINNIINNSEIEYSHYCRAKIADLPPMRNKRFVADSLNDLKKYSTEHIQLSLMRSTRIYIHKIHCGIKMCISLHGDFCLYRKLT